MSLNIQPIDMTNLINSESTIHLVGDAILDNYYWLTDKTLDLQCEIGKLGYKVNNYAVDDTKVFDLINGIAPKRLYVKSRSYPYPTEKDGKMYPLRLLSQSIGSNRSFSAAYGGIKPIGIKSESNHTVVVSMGGNDLRTKILSLLLGADNFISSVVTAEFITNCERVINIIRTSCDKMILISIYLPYLGPGSSYKLYSSLAKPVMDKWHDFLYKIAKKHNIPVLDLSRTFNYNDRSHYGTSETYPSNISNKCIAECISHIHANYQGHKVYYAPNCDSNKIIAES